MIKKDVRKSICPMCGSDKFEFEMIHKIFHCFDCAFSGKITVAPVATINSDDLSWAIEAAMLIRKAICLIDNRRGEES